FPSYNFDVIDGVTYQIDLSQPPKYDSSGKPIHPDANRIQNLVLSGKATIGIGGAVVKQDDSIVTERIGHSFMLPVAARNHTLAGIGRPLTLGDVREEV
ncbi:LysR substrate-binding domain-containing protein, partial [Rhizobium ruizarguesonis]